MDMTITALGIQNKMKKKTKYIILIALCLLLLLALPVIIWHLEPDKLCRVAIIDKTVPNETCREHNGLVFLLNHLKYRNKSGVEYDLSKDYYGFFPNEKEKSYDLKPLPPNYDDYDVIYLADTYGVYVEDLPWIEKEREGSRSDLIYGALEDEEWRNIIDSLEKEDKGLLIVEYNAFASPTEKDVRESVTDYLGIDWSGWVGRYFCELDYEKNIEIPQWIVDEFGESWNYSGPGFLLVNDLDYRICVLEGTKHVLDQGIGISFSEEGKDFFGLDKSPEYSYWFDIITPKQGSTVLAGYDWTLTKEGKKLLEENGIPDDFVAVVKTEHGASTSYYFAGDYNDMGKLPRFYKFKGLQRFYSFSEDHPDYTFYWSTYFPMMDTILEEFMKGFRR